MKIGIAEFEESPARVTVFHFQARVLAAIGVRSGSPGVTGSEPLRLGYEAPHCRCDRVHRELVVRP